MKLVRTLRGRLLAVALVWCGLLLFATGFSLQTLMRNYWQEAEADSLRLQVYDLLARIDVQPNGLPAVTEAMSDPRFNQPYSGYYWQLELGHDVVGRSRSLWDTKLITEGLKSAFGDPDLFVGKGPNREPLLVMTRTVLLPGSDRVFTLVMAKDSSALTQTLNKTRISLFLGLG
ncbi:MAG: sensor histidine kinase, partial [Aeromonas sp.]